MTLYASSMFDRSSHDLRVQKLESEAQLYVNRSLNARFTSWESHVVLSQRLMVPTKAASLAQRARNRLLEHGCSIRRHRFCIEV